MTDDELERMRAYAEAAREHPTWSVAYARDVPKLVAEVERLTLSLRQWPDAWRRLRFAEMILDRVGAEVDGVPWREAARLSESLDGEPVTEPLAPTGKLVRDRIPERIEANGQSCVTRILEGDDFRRALADKLVEEAQEFRDTGEPEELADVAEVLRALVRLTMTLEQASRQRAAKAESHGAFERRIFLESVSGVAPASDPGVSS